MIDFQQ